jgi:predicted RNA binding protein with dsRBD fold (UPF0201 family)
VRNELVSQESFLLRNINSINTLLTATEKKKKVDDVLNQMISPQHWKSSNGDEIEVQTVHMNHSTELIRIYQSLDKSKVVDQTGKYNVFLYGVID